MVREKRARIKPAPLEPQGRRWYNGLPEKLLGFGPLGIRMHSLLRIERGLTRTLEAINAALLFLMAAVVLTLVALRYVFGTGIVGANETVTILFVYTTALGAAGAIGKREHIAIPFLVDKLGTRGRRAAELTTFLAVGLLNAVMLVYSFRWIELTGSYIMPATELPRSALQAAVPVGCGLALVYCLIGALGVWARTEKGG